VNTLTLCVHRSVGYGLAVEQAVVSARDDRLVAALQAGDEAAYTALVQEHGGAMLRVAQLFVPSRAVAEEVVQEAWIGVLRGIDRFEGRSSLKTWIFRILTNTAKTRAVREGRSIPFSALAGEEAAADDPSVDPDRFLGESSRYAGHWNGNARTPAAGRGDAAGDRAHDRDAAARAGDGDLHARHRGVRGRGRL
jgi:RNA polymerase sigma factor (sigma-70 family)